MSTRSLSLFKSPSRLSGLFLASAVLLSGCGIFHGIGPTPQFNPLKIPVADNGAILAAQECIADAQVDLRRTIARFQIEQEEFRLSLAAADAGAILFSSEMKRNFEPEPSHIVAFDQITTK